LGIRTIVIALCAIYKEISFSTTYTIFDEELFPKCTNSHTKEHKLYDKLLDKISLEIESLVPGSSRKDKLAPVSIPHMPISSIQNSPLTYSSSLFLSYKFLFPLFHLL